MTVWIETGSPAPPFSLVDSDGQVYDLAKTLAAAQNRFDESETRRGGNPVAVVMYFYPRDDTPGCTKQACGFRDRWSDFQTRGVTVWGVSPDDAESHRKFRDKFDLPFPLLIDSDHRVATAYGAYREKNMYGKKSMGIVRSTFLIGVDGTVVKTYKRVRVDGHDEAVLGVIDGA